MTDAHSLPDAADDVTTNNRRGDQARYDREDAQVVRKIMMTKAGRAWMFRDLEACHIYDSIFVPGQPDTTAYNLGERNIGNKRLAQIMVASSDLYLTMIQEAREEQQRIDKVTRERNDKTTGKAAEIVSQFPDVVAPPGFKT